MRLLCGGFAGLLFGCGLLGCHFCRPAFRPGSLACPECFSLGLPCFGFPGRGGGRFIGTGGMFSAGSGFCVPVCFGLCREVTLDLQRGLLDHRTPGGLVGGRCCRRWRCSCRCGCGHRGFGWGKANRGGCLGRGGCCRFGDRLCSRTGSNCTSSRWRRSGLLRCLVGLHDQGLLHQRGRAVGYGLPGFGQRLLLGLGTLCCSGKLRRGFGGFLILILAAEKTKHVVGSGKASVPPILERVMGSFVPTQIPAVC